MRYHVFTSTAVVCSLNTVAHAALCAARLRRGSKDEGSAYDRLISDLLSLCAVRSEEDVPAASELFVLVHEVIVNLAIPFAEPRATLGPRSDSSPEGTPPAR